MSKLILIVGAGGFIGGFLTQEALSRGLDVTCMLRSSTSRRRLTDSRLSFAVCDDFDSIQAIADALGPDTLPAWDYIIYNLGATKVVRYLDFSRINYEYLRDFTNALKLAGKVPEKFLYMSSLSAMGPKDEKNYTPLTEEMIPTPNTRYGSSKLKAEVCLMSAGIPYIIFRATGIYGPRDHDYFLMFESIRKGFDFSVGFRRQQLTFIFVEDLARAIYDALEKAPTGEVYNISEERGYSQKEFRELSMREMKKRLVIPVKVPVWGLKAVSWVAEKIGMLRGKPSTLNSDKYHIMKQRNWNADISKARRDFGFSPQVSLEEGVRRSVEWYREEGWLK